jgi:hypothetical protein
MTEIRELMEMDLEAVSGGGLIDLPPITTGPITTVVQTNVGVAPTLAISLGGSATAVGELGLKNTLKL